MKTISEKLELRLYENKNLFIAEIKLPKWVCEELDQLDYVKGYDGTTITATEQDDKKAIHTIITRLQELGYTGTAKLRRMADLTVYEITVKNWMLKPATPDFDFQSKWNNNIPMPMAVMEGVILEETRGMYKMRLKGSAEPSTVCRVCGKRLTNKLSLLYGIGPECAENIGLPRIATEEELDKNFEAMKKQAEKIVWEGWVIKSAIKKMIEVNLDEAENVVGC